MPGPHAHQAIVPPARPAGDHSVCDSQGRDTVTGGPLTAPAAPGR
jgi:hypothetical protein